MRTAYTSVNTSYKFSTCRSFAVNVMKTVYLPLTFYCDLVFILLKVAFTDYK